MNQVTRLGICSQCFLVEARNPFEGRAYGQPASWDKSHGTSPHRTYWVRSFMQYSVTVAGQSSSTAAVTAAAAATAEESRRGAARRHRMSPSPDEPSQPSATSLLVAKYGKVVGRTDSAGQRSYLTTRHGIANKTLSRENTSIIEKVWSGLWEEGGCPEVGIILGPEIAPAQRGSMFRKFWESLATLDGDNPWQPKVFEVKFSLRKIERNFHIKIRNFKLWKMPK